MESVNENLVDIPTTLKELIKFCKKCPKSVSNINDGGFYSDKDIVWVFKHIDEKLLNEFFDKHTQKALEIQAVSEIFGEVAKRLKEPVYKKALAAYVRRIAV
ncbi:hypothetical protein CSB37_03510 [bacterium DOLZORAL124_38_8]|nr:MAG: hypothetical protein CSB37_03510 [bacterium DOLZORAL124_38_8]